MKRHCIAALAAGLLYAGTSGAHAVTFLPVVSPPSQGAAAGAATGIPPAGAVLFAPSRLRMSLFGTVWNLPKTDISGVTGVAGDRLQLDALTMPLVEAEYRLSDRWGVGGWYNPLNTDVRLTGPTADRLTSGPSPFLSSNRLATMTLNMWDAHLNYQFPRNLALQAGVVNYHGSLDAQFPNPSGTNLMRVKSTVGGTEAHVWGYKTYKIWGYSGRPAYFTGGLGVRHRVSNESNSATEDTAAQASAAFSYHPADNLSLDVAAWFADFTDDKAYSVRVNAGVTGHF